jgi:hypothetical protein
MQRFATATVASGVHSLESPAHATKVAFEVSPDQFLEAARRRFHSLYSAQWPSSASSGGLTKYPKHEKYYQAPQWGLINIPKHVRARLVEMNVAVTLETSAKEGHSNVMVNVN